MGRPQYAREGRDDSDDGDPSSVFLKKCAMVMLILISAWVLVQLGRLREAPGAFTAAVALGYCSLVYRAASRLLADLPDVPISVVLCALVLCVCGWASTQWFDWTVVSEWSEYAPSLTNVSDTLASLMVWSVGVSIFSVVCWKMIWAPFRAWLSPVNASRRRVLEWEHERRLESQTKSSIKVAAKTPGSSKLNGKKKAGPRKEGGGAQRVGQNRRQSGSDRGGQLNCHGVEASNRLATDRMLKGDCLVSIRFR